MPSIKKALVAASAVATLIGGLALSGQVAAGASAIEEGKKIAFDRRLGNCLACHDIPGGSLPGNIGPPLVAMKARYPDKAKLRAQIWDATAINPHSLMPPFGKHGILTDEQVDKVTEFIHSL